MTLRLHNTLTRRVEAFVPQDPQRVTMYLCGPTVYNYVHIGNARGPVVFGLLVRLLKREFGAEHVVYARNITDVDDKINAAANELNVPIETITKRYAAAYDDDIRKLGVDAPDLVPYATQHIEQIVAMCQAIDRQRQRVRGGRSCVVRCRVVSAVWPFVGPVGGRNDRGRASGSSAVQKKSRRFRLVETVDAGVARMGKPLGPWTTRLAHRVFRDVRSASRRDHRHPRRR